MKSLADVSLVESPINRCHRHGPRTLSLRECLGVLLVDPSSLEGSTGRGPAALSAAEASPGFPAAEEPRAFFSAMESLVTGDSSELDEFSPVQGARLLAAYELARRYHAWREAEKRSRRRAKRNRSDLVAAALAEIPSRLRADTHEWMGFVPIYAGPRAGRLCVAAYGTRTHVNVDPADLFARVLALRPQGVLLTHNHPSGDLTPSGPDRDLTRAVGDVLSRLGIEFIGHWIVTAGGEAEVR